MTHMTLYKWRQNTYVVFHASYQMLNCSQSASIPHTHSFRAFTAKHLTTVCAAFAFTFTSLPKAIRLPAFLAALCLVLTMQMPGMTNFPVFLVSLVASSARASKIFPISDFLLSVAVAKASAMPPLEIDFTLFMAFFIPFFMAFIAFLAIVNEDECVDVSQRGRT